MEYRREIDGLRGLAVISVIFFHAGFQSFSGGFIGVDVFFVISGYLITSIIANEIESGSFSFSSFYERRVRRIIPALFFVIASCLPFAWFWLMPDDLKNFSQSLIGVTTFLANIFFWKTTDYFDTATDLKPLIHTWSLAVEEQYYFIFPILLIFIWRFDKIKIFLLLSTIALLSLTYTEYIIERNPETAFYLLPSRAWELLAGSIVALLLKYKNQWFMKNNGSEIGSLLGLIFIIYSIIVFNNKTPFPGVYALFPTIGACLIILFARPSTFIGNLLSHRLFVGIGLISYSAYLWHQPLFSFYRHINTETPEKIILGILSLATLFLAFFTWKFIEIPFRNRKKFNRKSIYIFFTFGTLIFILLGLTGSATKGFLNYKLTTAQRVQLQTASSSPMRDKCHTGGADYLRAPDACEYFKGDTTVAVFGDSHTVELAYALAKKIEPENMKVKHFSFSACVPSFGEHYQGKLKSCSDWTNETVQYIAKNQEIKFVVVSYRIHAALFGDHKDSYPELPESVNEDERLMRWNSYVNTLKYLSDHGKNVILILQAPELPKSIIRMVANVKESKLDLPGVGYNWWNKRTEYVQKNLNQLPTDIVIIDPSVDFCDANQCYAVKNNISLYFDDDHMSVKGADIISARIKDKIEIFNKNLN